MSRPLEGRPPTRRVILSTALAGLLVASALATSACQPDPEPEDLGALSLRLWQPAGFGEDGTDLFADADEAVLEVIVDGESETRPLEDGTVDNLELPPEGGVVQLVLRTTGTFGEAVARTNPVAVEAGGELPAQVAFLAPPGLHPLDEGLPDERTEAALCADGEGRAALVGGVSGGALAFGSWELDPEGESVVEGPGLPDRRRGAACVLADDATWLLGGCELDGTPTRGVVRSIGGAPFSSAGADAPSGVSCGTAAVATTAGFALQGGERLERRDKDGEVVFSESLSEARYGADLIALSDDTLLLAGGTSAPGAGAAVEGGLALSPDGEITARPELDGGALLARRGEGAVTYFDGRIAALDADGPGQTFVEAAWIDAPVGFEPVQLLPLAGERFALLGADGEVLLDVGEQTRTLTLDPPRPGARMARGPGGAVVLLGGGAGALLYISDD